MVAKSRCISLQSGYRALAGIRGRDARELRSHVIDDEQVAVRAIVVAQAEIGTSRLRIGDVIVGVAFKLIVGKRYSDHFSW